MSEHRENGCSCEEPPDMPELNLDRVESALAAYLRGPEYDGEQAASFLLNAVPELLARLRSVEVEVEDWRSREHRYEPPARLLLDAGVRIDSLIPGVADGEEIAVSHPDWNGGKPVDLFDLRRVPGDCVNVVLTLPETRDRTSVTVPADFLVIPA